MSRQVNPDLITEFQKYGAFDINGCFNCGNCTAICPLSQEDSTFPRKMIRYAQVGLKDKVLDKKELWLCYYCGECSTTCPRQAEPGEFMAAARRYAIANYDLTGLASLLYRSNIFNAIIMLALALFFALFISAHAQHIKAGEKLIEIFNIPFDLIHDMGIILLLLVGIAFFAGFIKMMWQILDIRNLISIIKARIKNRQNKKTLKDITVAAFKTAVNEIINHKRFQDCDEEKQYPILLKPWFLHANMVWGFILLLLATTLDFLFKDPAITVPLWYPMRLMGTIGGILVMYGSSIIIINRIRKSEKSYSHSFLSDWWFLLIIWFATLSGFLLELSLYLPHRPSWADIMFLIHVSLSMELIVMAPFTKFAHVFYRPFALFIHALKNEFKTDVTA